MAGSVSLVTGVPGSGKTLGFVRWLVNDFLRCPDGVLLTNIRLHPDIIANYVSSSHGFLARHFGYAPSYDEVFERMRMLSDEQVSRLRNCLDVSGFFKDILGCDYDGSYICIDEVHTYCAVGLAGAVLRSWADWLATVRHSHIRFCGLTQDISQVDRCLKSRVESRIEYLSPDSLRDPYLKIPLCDWYGLLSAITNHHIRVVCSAEYKRSVNGRWKLSDTFTFRLDESIFRFYDSFQVSGL